MNINVERADKHNKRYEDLEYGEFFELRGDLCVKLSKGWCVNVNAYNKMAINEDTKVRPIEEMYIRYS